jgi:hypothetical protein
MTQLRPALLNFGRLNFARPPHVALRLLSAFAIAGGLLMTAGFESPNRLGGRIIKPMPRHFTLTVVEGQMAPNEARFRRSGNTYVNEAPDTDGSNLMRASWFAVHPTDANAVLIEYPAVDPSGNTVYRLEYALEEDRNRYRLYRLNEERLTAALDVLESAVRRGDASRGQRRRYEALTKIWNAHVSSQNGAPGEQFHVSSLDDVNAIIDFSRRRDDGEKVITSTGDVVELYIR